MIYFHLPPSYDVSNSKTNNLNPLDIFKAINTDKNAKNIIADYDISLKNETDWAKKMG